MKALDKIVLLINFTLQELLYRIRHAILSLDQRSGRVSAHLCRCLPFIGVCSIDLVCRSLRPCFS